MQGELYIIKNNINNKVYIGKTYKNTQYRFKEHLETAYKVNSPQYNYKIYRAIRKYKSENFYVEKIGVFEEGILEQKECEYIHKYNAYYNGYNSTLGGDGNRRELKMEKYSQSIISMYTDRKSIATIAYELDTSINSIKNILISNNVEINHNTNPKDTRIVQYDKQFNPIAIFNFKTEIANWLVTKTDYAFNERTLYTAINTSCNTGCIRYGHRWQRMSDLIYDGKTFRSIFDIRLYKEGMVAYKPDGKLYYIVDGAVDEIVKAVHRVRVE